MGTFAGLVFLSPFILAIGLATIHLLRKRSSAPPRETVGREPGEYYDV